MNLYKTIFDRARGATADVAFECDDGTRVTHGEFHALVGRIAGNLAEASVEPGDRVVAQIEKSVEAIALYLATLRIGAIFVPLNTAYTQRELEYFVADSEPRVLVCAPAKAAFGAAVCAAARVTAEVHTLAENGAGSLLEHPVEADAEIVERRSDDLAAILYTSGTTGRSKGAMLSHGNLAANAQTLRTLWGWRRDDVLLHVLPVYHVHGLFVAMHCALLEPSTVLFQQRFDPGTAVRALARSTVFMGVPTHYVRLLESESFTAQACEGVRLFISGSAPLRRETFDAFEARTGQRILERYGMTEAGMITSNPLQGPRVAGTVGFALPGVALRVVDDAGGIVDDEGIGTLEIRGPNVFKGYWRKPEKTREDFHDGWFVTGDLASRDAEGRVSIVGRGKDLIISGGLNVYPKEVEQVLDTLPGVSESAVFGVAHPDFGEGVVAAVVGDGSTGFDEAALRARLREMLAAFKVPQRIVELEALPRNAMGKVQKNLLRDRYVDVFG